MPCFKGGTLCLQFLPWKAEFALLAIKKGLEKDDLGLKMAKKTYFAGWS